LSALFLVPLEVLSLNRTIELIPRPDSENAHSNTAHFWSFEPDSSASSKTGIRGRRASRELVEWNVE